MRVLKAVVPLVVGVAIVGSALVVSGALETKTAMVTGTIYTCNGVFGTTCRAEATAGLIIELTELGLVRHTFSAVSHTDGSYLLQFPLAGIRSSCPAARRIRYKPRISDIWARQVF